MGANLNGLSLEDQVSQLLFGVQRGRTRLRPTAAKIIETVLSARSEGPHPESGEWVMVPRVPTPEMCWAWANALNPLEAWSKMIAASPPPLEGAGREDGSSRSQPVLSPKSDNAGGWITWSGGDCPVPKGTLIDVRYSDGQTMLGIPALEYHGKDGNRCAFNWRKFAGGGCIVGYRIATPESGIIRRSDVIDLLSRIAEEHADFALEGGENARAREAAEAALTRVKYAVAFLPALADGTLGRQDEVVQPIRDEPISPSKGEALPVVSEEMVTEAMTDAWAEICEDTGCHPQDIVQLGRKRIMYEPRQWTALIAMRLQSLLTAVLPRPASDKAEEAKAREFVENWFSPWGAWKTAWWEGEVSDDVPMTDAAALKHLRSLLSRGEG